MRIICDSGVTHEIVRHRIASYSQESTRYCNYGNAKDIVFILPSVYYPIYDFEKGNLIYPTEDRTLHQRFVFWESACLKAESAYMNLIECGASPQEARSVLPNSLKTEIVVTMNLREWRHFFRLRTASAAHPDMRAITIPMLKEFQEKMPIIFDDVEVK